jgi:hypothetical protein
VLVSVALLVAIALLGVAAGLMFTRGALAVRPRGSRLVTLLLGVDAGIVLVGGIALAAAAGRSWDRLGDSKDSADALIHVSRLDGDGNLFALFVVIIGLLTLLGATLLATASRCVDGDQPGDATVVSAVLWGQVAAAGYCGVRVLLGADGLPFVLIALHLPLSLAALLLQRHRRPMVVA